MAEEEVDLTVEAEVDSTVEVVVEEEALREVHLKKLYQLQPFNKQSKDFYVVH